MHVIAASQHKHAFWLFGHVRANAFTQDVIVQNETVKTGTHAASRDTIDHYRQSIILKNMRTILPVSITSGVGVSGFHILSPVATVSSDPSNRISQNWSFTSSALAIRTNPASSFLVPAQHAS